MRRLSVLSCVFVLAAIPAAYAQAPAEPVTVYDATQIPLDSYVVLKRLWVEGWRSAFYIRAYPDEASARQALLSEAARLGADGVINLHCLGQSDAIFYPSGYYCYGNAIRLKNEQRIPG